MSDSDNLIHFTDFSYLKATETVLPDWFLESLSHYLSIIVPNYFHSKTTKNYCISTEIKEMVIANPPCLIAVLLAGSFA